MQPHAVAARPARQQQAWIGPQNLVVSSQRPHLAPEFVRKPGRLVEHARSRIDDQTIAAKKRSQGQVHIIQQSICRQRYGQLPAHRIVRSRRSKNRIDRTEALTNPHLIAPVQTYRRLFDAAALKDHQLTTHSSHGSVRQILQQQRQTLRRQALPHIGENQNRVPGRLDSRIESRSFAAPRHAQ